MIKSLPDFYNCDVYYKNANSELSTFVIPTYNKEFRFASNILNGTRTPIFFSWMCGLLG